MALVRIDPFTVRDDTTGSVFFIPDPSAPAQGLGELPAAAPGGSLPPPGFEGMPLPGTPTEQRVPGDPSAGLVPWEPSPLRPVPDEPLLDPYAAPAPPLAEEPPAPGPRAAAPERPAPSEPRGYPTSREQLARRQEGTFSQEERALRAETAVARAEGEIQRRSAEDVAREKDAFARQYADAAAEGDARAWGRMEQWLGDYERLAGQDPNPENYWSSRSDFGKAAWLLSIAIQGFLRPGERNVAMELLQKHIDDDISRQERGLERRRGALDARGRALAADEERGRRALGDRVTAHNLRLDSLLAVADARSRGLTDQRLLAGYQRARAQLSSRKDEAAAGLFSNYQTEEQASVQRAFQAAEAGRQRAFQSGENELNRQLQRDLARVEVGAKESEAAARAGKEARERAVHVDTGLYREENGRRVPALAARSEEREKMAGAATAGNRQYTALVALREALKDQGLLDTIRGSSGATRSEAMKLAYAAAKAMDPSGRLSDQDVQAAMESVSGQKGLGAWDYLKTPGSPDTLVEEGLRNVRREVENSAVTFSDATAGPVYWEPRLLEGKAPGKRTPQDVRSEFAQKYGGSARVESRRTGSALPGPAGEVQREAERAAGTAPLLGQQEEADVRGITAAANRQSPEEIDRLIETVRSSTGLSEEGRNRALADLRLSRVKSVLGPDLNALLARETAQPGSTSLSGAAGGFTSGAVVRRALESAGIPPEDVELFFRRYSTVPRPEDVGEVVRAGVLRSRGFGPGGR